jgi:hypothetical protein
VVYLISLDGNCWFEIGSWLRLAASLHETGLRVWELMATF